MTASSLDDLNDKASFVATCRRIYAATKSNLHRILAIDARANVAIYAALSGRTAVLEALWPYSASFVNRLWEVRHGLPFHLCRACERGVCMILEHEHVRGTSVFSRLTSSVFDRCDLGRITACFECPAGQFTLLHFAALCGDAAVISWLLDHGADINSLCTLWSCHEVYSGNPRYPQTRDRPLPQMTPLQLALCNRNPGAARLLVRRGAAVHLDQIQSLPRPLGGQSRPRQLEGRTPPMCVAAAFGVSETVEVLLGMGVPVGQRDLWGYTALHHAADSCWEEEYFDIFKVLVDAGADLTDDNNDGHRTPLAIAFRQGNFAAANCLLSLGASLSDLETHLKERYNDRDRLGLLHFACGFEANWRGLRSTVHSCFGISRNDDRQGTFSPDSWEKARYRLVVKLLDLGYDPNARASFNHRWCRDDAEGYLPPEGQIDRMTWETECRSIFPSRYEMTALGAVSPGCDPDLMALLIRRGAEVDAQDKDGFTPLWRLFGSLLRVPLSYQRADGCEGAVSYEYLPPLRPTVRWQEKMELLLRNGAQIDPWATSASSDVSDMPFRHVFLDEPDKFSFIVENMMSRNISTGVRLRLATSIVAQSAFNLVADQSSNLKVAVRGVKLLLTSASTTPESGMAPTLAAIVKMLEQGLDGPEHELGLVMERVRVQLPKLN